ncbi:MAG: tetratricopeptide repeat protein [Candidatus Heimdallarchaeota archaeon]|nr:tetratricopeptide repeat protein [Candidatus Heimdallarchaeota archaeon]MCK4877055.1 tetratricopeptide repeat protein [Candidatus Heimdallarchaeota archaeon]
MNTSIEQELEELENLILAGQCYEVIDRVDALFKKKEISKEEELRAKLLKGEAIYWLGVAEYNLDRHQASFDLLNQISKECKKLDLQKLNLNSLFLRTWNSVLSDDQQLVVETITEMREIFENIKLTNTEEQLKMKIHMLICESWISFSKIRVGIDVSDDDLDINLEMLKQSLEVSKEIDYKKGIWWSQIFTGFMLNNKNRYEEALETLERNLILSKELGNDIFYLFSLQIISIIYFYTSQWESYYQNILQRRELYEKFENSRGDKAFLNFQLGIYYANIGELSHSIEKYEESLKAYREQNYENLLEINLNNLGWTYRLLGELDRAREYFQESYQLYIDKNLQYFSFARANLGELHLLRGELDEALEIFEEQLPLLEKQQELKNILSWYHRELGKIYWYKGLIDKAFETFKRSHQLLEEVGIKQYYSGSLLLLISLSIEVSNLDLAKEFFRQLETIKDEIDDKDSYQRYLLSKALILKNSTIDADRDQAELIFEQLLEEVIDYALKVDILFNLSELLLEKLAKTDKKEIFEKIYEFTNTLLSLSKDNNSSILFVETSWLLSQLALIDGDVKKARALLSEAFQVANERGLEGLALKIIKEQEKITKQAILFQDLEKKKIPISARMQTMDIQESFKIVKKERLVVTSKEETETSRKLFSISI